MPYGSFTPSETIQSNGRLDSLANGINWTIPYYVSGLYWIASVTRSNSQLNGYAPRNPAGFQGNTINPMLTISIHCALRYHHTEYNCFAWFRAQRTHAGQRCLRLNFHDVSFLYCLERVDCSLTLLYPVVRWIARADCNSTEGGGHDYCSSDKYCDTDGRCFACEYCSTANDAWDGICPVKCGGQASYQLVSLRC
jgi:hypothetical protein